MSSGVIPPARLPITRATGTRVPRITGFPYRGIPLSMAVGDLTRFWFPRRSTPTPDADFANPLQPQMPMPHLLARVKPPSIARGFISPAFEALERLETREPWRLSGLDATKACLE